MEAKAKIGVAAGFTSLVIAVAALTMAPVGALNNNYMPHHPPMSSSDTFDATSKIETKTENENEATVNQNGSQTAYSGEASATKNDNVAGVNTGSASNTGSGKVMVDQSNSIVAGAPAVSAPAIDDSMDHVKLSSYVETKVENENEATVTQSFNQTATTGTATAACNDNITAAVSTGDASNDLTLETSVTQSN